MKNPAKFLTLLILITFSLSFSGSVEAFSSNSSSFKLEGEFGIFGGAKSSASYNLTDTGGGFAVGFSNSSSYAGCSGFQCVLAQVPSITFTLSATSVNLGTLSTSTVNTGNHTANVKTNLGGYTLRVIEDGDLRRGGDNIDDVDGTIGSCSGSNDIDAGCEEYGLATSESGQNITQDTDCSNSPYNASAITNSAQSVANATGPTSSSGETTTLCYAASRAGLTPAGAYQQILTYIATGSF